MIAVAKKTAPAASYNPPRWAPGWIDSKTGKPQSGYWYVYHAGKKFNLSKHGAPRKEVKGRAYHQEVIPAYHAWELAHSQQQAQSQADEAKLLEELEQDRIAKAGPVLVADVVNNYLLKLEKGKGSKGYKENAKRYLIAFCTGCDGKGHLGNCLFRRMHLIAVKALHGL